MKIETTNRGFRLIAFTDLSVGQCSLQESSLAINDAIWLGCDTPTIGYLPSGGVIVNTRMHLNREQVQELLPYLQNFVKGGRIS